MSSSTVTITNQTRAEAVKPIQQNTNHIFASLNSSVSWNSSLLQSESVVPSPIADAYASTIIFPNSNHSQTTLAHPSVSTTHNESFVEASRINRTNEKQIESNETNLARIKNQFDVAYNLQLNFAIPFTIRSSTSTPIAKARFRKLASTETPTRIKTNKTFRYNLSSKSLLYLTNTKFLMRRKKVAEAFPTTTVTNNQKKAVYLPPSTKSTVFTTPHPPYHLKHIFNSKENRDKDRKNKIDTNNNALNVYNYYNTTENIMKDNETSSYDSKKKTKKRNNNEIVGSTFDEINFISLDENELHKSNRKNNDNKEDKINNNWTRKLNNKSNKSSPAFPWLEQLFKQNSKVSKFRTNSTSAGTNQPGNDITRSDTNINYASYEKKLWRTQDRRIKRNSNHHRKVDKNIKNESSNHQVQNSMEDEEMSSIISSSSFNQKVQEMKNALPTTALATDLSSTYPYDYYSNADDDNTVISTVPIVTTNVIKFMTTVAYGSKNVPKTTLSIPRVTPATPPPAAPTLPTNHFSNKHQVSLNNGKRPTIIIYPTVSPESIVIPIVSCILGFPVLALMVICCLRKRAKLARERDRRRHYDMEGHAVSLVRFSPIHRLNSRSPRVVSLCSERSLSRGFPSLELDTVVEERSSDHENTQTDVISPESPSDVHMHQKNNAHNSKNS